MKYGNRKSRFGALLALALVGIALIGLPIANAADDSPPWRPGDIMTTDQADALRESGKAYRPTFGAGEEFYRAKEFQIDLFGSASVERLRSAKDLEDHEAGFGFGVNYFFSRHLGIGYEVRGTARQVKHDFLNEGGLHALCRIPIGTVAPYGIAGAGYEIVNSELRGNLYAGAGLEVRLTPRIGTFAEARRVWDGPKDYDARAGIRFAW